MPESSKTITHYQFGKIEIDNHVYTDDVIIFGQEIIGSWWRSEGHCVYMEDFECISLEKRCP